ncbi:MAG: methylthioribulose 1-phosphate dehydratase [Gammaproteobacteria bacterium]|nr:methylthioribulose 1-phosphate dehydratase [Gammaproteobacteria bacterium]
MKADAQIAQQLINAGRELYQQGMVPATSGNFSARLADGNIAITVSGAHKGRLTADDIMCIDAQGKSLDGKTPSAETLLHTSIYQRYHSANVVLHPHSVNATVLSQLCDKWLHLSDYEVLKAFPGIDTHETSLKVPVFDNDQDITRLSKQADECLASLDIAIGYLIKGHGFYTWGDSMNDVLRHVEAFEFLFECELMLKKIKS